jgi:hypothetical protein
VGDLVSFEIDVAISGGGAVKSAEVVEALTPGAEVLPHRAVRVALGTRGPDGEIVGPLALERISALRRAGAERSEGADYQA